MPKTLDVIIADDEKSIADLVTDIVQNSGHSTRTFYDGQGALEAGRTTLPDVVFSDNRMPHVKGIELARQLLALAEAARKKVIFVLMSTTTTEDVDAHDSLRDQIQFLDKPFGMHDVVAILEAASRDLADVTSAGDTPSLEIAAQASKTTEGQS